MRLEGEGEIVKFGCDPELLLQPASPRVTKRRMKAAASLRPLRVIANSLYPHLWRHETVAIVITTELVRFPRFRREEQLYVRRHPFFRGHAEV